MSFVYSIFAFSTPFETPERAFPREKPLLAETCLLLGFVDIVMMYGVFPFRVLIFTMPEDMSPYSTEGTPVMTSMDSTFVEAMLLVLTPLAPELLLENALNEALLESLIPSTSTAVPNEALPLSPILLSPARMLNCWSPSNDGLMVRPPGRRLLTSVRFIIWMCSRAVLSIILFVVAELSFSFAVITTPSSARLSSAR